MWMIEVVTFLALSPSPYMMTPHPTAQYGQVLRVSVVRASLKLRVSASTAVGQNPNATRLDPARPAALALKNCLRFMSMACPLPQLSELVSYGLQSRSSHRHPLAVECCDATNDTRMAGMRPGFRASPIPRMATPLGTSRNPVR